MPVRSTVKAVSPVLPSELAARPTLAALFGRPEGERLRDGYADTLREILQQPDTWEETGPLAIEARGAIAACLAAAGVRGAAGTLVLTGSGSSAYVGDCLQSGLAQAVGTTVVAVPAGDLVTHAERCVPAGAPLVLVSIARSGDSPESVAAVDWFRRHRPGARHVVLTCNRDGALARVDDVTRVVLDDRTNDRSLVMTSSFTNLLLAGRVLAHLDGAGGARSYGAQVRAAAAAARELIDRHADLLGAVAGRGARRAVQLGTGPRLGAAREASLKLIEMTAGHVLSVAETFLGLRHGPLAALGPDTLLVAYLSSESSARRARAHELDVIAEVRRKRTGAFAVIVGEHLPSSLAGDDTCLLECPGRDALGDDDGVVLDVIVGQLLAFFSCLRLGLRPDSPSPRGLISRVVEPFAIHDER